MPRKQWEYWDLVLDVGFSESLGTVGILCWLILGCAGTGLSCGV